ncbi:MAG: HDOD domain-containing protein [Bdellovibrionales bacterium]|nr:HDOD domain-containing protein [Bdellovibrionales bacterium]
MVLGKYFSKKTAAANIEKPTANPLSPAMRGTIFQLSGNRNLPSMPRSAQRAFQLSIDPNASLQDFIELIEQDEGLASRIIRITNSVYFGRPEPCTTLNDAVINIGMQELKNLLNANTLCDIFPSKHPVRAQLWMHNVAVGIFSREIAKRLAPKLEGEAFLAGLMHDIGKLFLMQFQPVEFEKIVTKAFQKGEDFCPLEEDIFVCNHTEIGQYIGEKWTFPDSIQTVISLHHTPISTKDFGKQNLSLLDIVRASDSLAHVLGLGHPQERSAYQRMKERSMAGVWNLIKVEPNERQAFQASLKQQFEDEYQFYVRPG